MTDKPPESFGLAPGVVNMAWQFVGRTGRFAETVPEPAREGVRRALALAYLYFENTPGRTPTEEMARDMAAVAMLEAYERLMGEPLVTGLQGVITTPSVMELDQPVRAELAAKAGLSCFLSTSGVGNGEVYADGRTMWWDVVEHPTEGTCLGLSLRTDAREEPAPPDRPSTSVA